MELWHLESEVSKSLNSYDFGLPDERDSAVRRKASENAKYQMVRERISKGILRASRIADRQGVPIHVKSYPAPAVGGPVIPVNLFGAILADTSHGGIERQMIYDAINQTIGELEAALPREFQNLINPLYWIKELLVLTIRLPFIIIAVSGFDVHKIEGHLFARIFKVIEIIALVYFLARLGIAQDELLDTITQLIR